LAANLHRQHRVGQATALRHRSVLVVLAHQDGSLLV